MREWLHGLRTQNGITLKELGEKTGYTESAMCSIENGTRQQDMNISLAGKLAEIFGLTIDEIARLEAAEHVHP